LERRRLDNGRKISDERLVAKGKKEVGGVNGQSGPHVILMATYIGRSNERGAEKKRAAMGTQQPDEWERSGAKRAGCVA